MVPVQPAARGAVRLFEMQAQVIVDRFAQFRGRQTFGEMRADRREHVASMKCLAQRLQEIFVGRDHAHFVFLLREDHGQHAVVGCDEILPGGLGHNRAAGSAHAGIDHHHVHGFFREKAIGLGQHESGLGHLVRRYLVTDINDLRGWAQAQDDAFHGAHEVVGEAKIGEKSNCGRTHC